MLTLDRNLDAIRKLCDLHKVGSLFAFGSVTSDRFTERSDIDMVVRFREIDLETYADNYFSLKEGLEKLFERNIDLLEEQAIRNPVILHEIERSKKLIYGQGDQSMAA
jgi:uncharacterized protein